MKTRGVGGRGRRRDGGVEPYSWSRSSVFSTIDLLYFGLVLEGLLESDSTSHRFLVSITVTIPDSHFQSSGPTPRL